MTPDALTRSTDRIGAQIYQFGGWFPTTDKTEIMAFDDITEQHRTDGLLRWEKQALELIARPGSLAFVLDGGAYPGTY